jgi:hypothetical protein
MVIHGHPSSNPWSLECKQSLGTLTNTDHIVSDKLLWVFTNAGERLCDIGLYQVSNVRV